MNLRAARHLSVIASLLLASCASSHFYPYRFAPAPLEAQITTQSRPEALARALVTVSGIARPQKDGGAHVELRMRLENLGTVPVTLLDDSLSLVSADLETFGRPDVRPEEQRTIQPGGAVTFDIEFPMPVNRNVSQLNLQGLNLRWSVDFEGQTVTTGASFQLIEWGPNDDGYPDVHVGFGVGVVAH